MDRINAMTIFVQVAESGSFIGAGRHVGLSASAISKSIGRLEDRTGVRLFHRSTRNLTLTDEGRRYLERCQQILADIDAADAELIQARSTPAGKLKLSLPMFREPFVSALAKFQTAYRQIEIDVEFTDRKVDLIAEGVDVAIRTGEVSDSGLAMRRLGTFRMLLVAAPLYIDTFGKPSSPADLADHLSVRFRSPVSGKIQRWKFLQDGEWASFSPKSGPICSSIDGRLCLALAGAGITYVPDFTVADMIRSGRLLPLLDPFTQFQNQIQLLWATRKIMPPRLRAFVDFASENLNFEPDCHEYSRGSCPQ